MTKTLTKTPIPEVARAPEAAERVTSWLQALAVRGVTVTVRNNRIWLHPSSAYRALTDAEVITLRHHRQAIKDAVKAGISLDVVPAAPTVETVTPTPEPPCQWCGKSPTDCATLRDERPDVFDVIHGPSPEVTAKKDATASAVMRKMVGRESPYL
jgi:hypothetical protein